MMRKTKEELEGENARLVLVVRNIQKSLIAANELQDGPICDTIWHTPYETLFDYIEQALIPYGGT